jgi:D-serine deaminase-like pyridoxal phosphate-dependent protein
MGSGSRDLDRRAFLAAGTAAAGGVAASRLTGGPPAVAVAAERTRPLGAGGTPMSRAALAQLARREGRGHPVLLLDLAALDQNTGVIARFARAQRWAVRPALKSFRSPALSAYVLARLPEPRGLVFDLGQVDAIVDAAPPGVDLMGGYPPTVGELEAYLSTRPRRRRRHTLRLLIDSLPLMRELARLARSTPRRLPVEVALELDVGMGKGGMSDARELGACLKVLRAERERLRLSAVLGYDGHATLTGEQEYRRFVATEAQKAYRRHLADLERLGGDLFEARSLIRNGPASSNYRNWVGGPANEISPGSAFVFAGYLAKGFDTEGLAPALTACGCVRRITSGHPSTPFTQEVPPGATEEEIVVQAVGSGPELVWPPGAREDPLSGGGDALVVGKDAVRLGDYVLYNPEQSEDGVRRFGSMLAVREGRVRRRWAVEPRPATPASA